MRQTLGKKKKEGKVLGCWTNLVPSARCVGPDYVIERRERASDLFAFRARLVIIFLAKVRHERDNARDVKLSVNPLLGRRMGGLRRR